MTGIIGAMEVEVESVIAAMSDVEKETHSGITYVKGIFQGAEVVVAQCGMGKVNAAVCAQTMILMYSPEVVINTGVAGSLSPAVKIGDIVIGSGAVQHDFDLSPIGMENTTMISCAEGVVNRLEAAAKKTGNYHIGIIATGDQFIGNAEKKAEIANSFNALACEMEGAGIARVCQMNGTAFGIVRAVSDNADEGSDFDFNEFLEEAAKKSVEIISNFL